MLWIFLIPVFLLGIITSYEDIRFGKIRNIFTYGFFALAIIMNVFMFVFYSIIGVQINYFYFLNLLINILIAIIIAFAFWWIKIWSAGDAKLFIAFSALLPLTFYSNNPVKYFPSFIILINTFVPLFLLNLIGVFASSFKTIKHIQIKEIIPIILIIFGFSWFSSSILGFFGLPSNYITNIVLIYLLFWIIAKISILEKYKLVFLIIFCIARLILDRTIFTLGFWKTFLLITLGFAFFRIFLRKSFDVLYVKHIAISKLKPSRVLDKSIIKSGKKYIIDNEKIKQKDYLVEATSEGLTRSDINKIKRYKKKLAFNKIPVLTTMPFAPSLFVGVIITIIARGIFINLI